MAKQTWEIGCYGDGRLGHQHTRECCADTLECVRGESNPDTQYLEIDMTITDLRNAMTDDAYEEDAACAMLDELAPVDGATWGWRDGDFGLWPNEGE